jgi:ABC-type sulfate transport system substrate-binding protein
LIFNYKEIIVPITKGYSKKSIGKNITLEMSHGRSYKQSLAIALSTASKAKSKAKAKKRK